MLRTLFVVIFLSLYIIVVEIIPTLRVEPGEHYVAVREVWTSRILGTNPSCIAC